MPSLLSQIENAAYVEPLVRESLERIKARIEQMMTSNRRNASGRSVGSLRIETTGVGGTLYGLKSFRFMERGRGAGKVPYRFTDIIAQWIQDKGITLYSLNGQQTTPRRVAWLIADKIRREGTALHRMGQKQDIYTSAVEEEFVRLSEKIIVQFSSDIHTLIQSI